MTVIKRYDARRYARVETRVKVKLPGDLAWTESAAANVSVCGLLFDTAKRLSIGDFTALQFMLQNSPDVGGNAHFFVSAKVIWIAPIKGLFKTAVELIVNDDMRSEIAKTLGAINPGSVIKRLPTFYST
jgi:Tfp pilus assembly protein PilZ